MTVRARFIECGEPTEVVVLDWKNGYRERMSVVPGAPKVVKFRPRPGVPHYDGSVPLEDAHDQVEFRRTESLATFPIPGPRTDGPVPIYEEA